MRCCAGMRTTRWRSGGGSPPLRPLCLLLRDDLVGADGPLEVIGVPLRRVVRAHLTGRDATGRLLDRTDHLAVVRVGRDETRLLERFRRVDEVGLGLELGDVRRVAPRYRVRIFDVELRDRVLVVPLRDVRPGGVLVLALRGDIPDRTRATDGEGRSRREGRLQDLVNVLLRLGLVRGLPAAVDPAAFEQKRELAVAFLLAHRRPWLGRREDLLR